MVVCQGLLLQPIIGENYKPTSKVSVPDDRYDHLQRYHKGPCPWAADAVPYASVRKNTIKREGGRNTRPMILVQLLVVPGGAYTSDTTHVHQAPRTSDIYAAGRTLCVNY